MEEYQQLVIHAKAKDVNAFAMLYELVYEDMYHMAFYMLGNVQDAEDVVSETVLAAFESIQKLRSAENFRGWIFKILLNKCRRRRKAYLTKAASVEEQLEHAAGSTRKETLPGKVEAVLSEGRADALSKEEAMDLKAAFLRLPETDRTILAMSLFGGYKSEEIGKHLHLNANTVRTRRSRALGRLQNMLL